MERNIVLAHELVELHLIRVLPPLFPLRGVVGGNRKITDRSIEPDVKHLVPESIQRDGYAPFEVTRDASRGQAGLEPRLSDGLAVRRPFAPFGHIRNPVFIPFLQLRQVEEEMPRFFLNRREPIELAARIDQLDRVEQLLASITLITTGIVVSAIRAGTFDKAIGKEALVLVTPQLHHGVLDRVLVGVGLQENVLADRRLPFGCGPSKVIKVDPKPLVGLNMECVVLVAEFPRRHALLQRLGFRRRPVFVRSANIERVVSSQTTVSGKHVGRKHGSNNVPQMRNVVDIWKGRRDQDVAFILLRKAGKMIK